MLHPMIIIGECFVIQELFFAKATKIPNFLQRDYDQIYHHQCDLPSIFFRYLVFPVLVILASSLKTLFPTAPTIHQHICL